MIAFRWIAAGVAVLSSVAAGAEPEGWKEVAPKGSGPGKVVFWEDAFARMTATEEWTKQLALYEWHPQFLRSREFIQYLDAQHNANRTIMSELGLVK